MTERVVDVFEMFRSSPKTTSSASFTTSSASFTTANSRGASNVRSLIRPASFLVLFLIGHYAQAQGPSEIRARLVAAANAQALEDPTLHPWHVKLAVQLFTASGKPGDAGTIEEWWAGPAKYRITFASPSYKATVLKTADGFYRSPDTGRPPYLLELLRREVVRPLPTSDELEKSQPELRRITSNKVDLDCIMLDRSLKGVTQPPLGLFPTYCLARGGNALRVQYLPGTSFMLPTKLGRFQGRDVAAGASVLTSGVEMAREDIVALDTIADDSPVFAATDDLVAGESDLIPLEGIALTGRLLNRTDPIYPLRAKQNGIAGTVVLHAIIGTDGSIHFLELIDSPDPDLAVAAMSAVRTWKYKPYELGGHLTDVDATIKVNFSFSR